MAGFVSSGPCFRQHREPLHFFCGRIGRLRLMTVRTSLGTLHLLPDTPAWLSRTQVHPAWSKQYAGSILLAIHQCNKILHESTYTRITFMIPASTAPPRYTMCFLRGGSSIRSRNFYAQWERMCHRWKQRADANTEMNAYPLQKVYLDCSVWVQ
jgi:hypothetical protein